MRLLDAFSRQRAALVGAVAALAIAGRTLRPAPPARSLPGLASLLGKAAGGVVKPDEIVWEPSSGVLSELFLGRRVFFLAARAHGAPRDVYRARVRLTIDGQPLSVGLVRNITDTPVGDDMALAASGQNISYATLAFGHIQSVSVLDTTGIRAGDRPARAFDRALLAFTSFQDTGTWAGLGRTDIVLDVPAESAKLTLTSSALQIDLGDAKRGLFYDTGTRKLLGPDHGKAYAARAVPQLHVPKPWLLWLVDTVRAEVGPEPIAWLENVVFGLRDDMKRTAYRVFNASSKRGLRKASPNEVRARVLDASDFANAADSWPPPPIPSLWQDPRPGEGVWKPVTYRFLKPMLGLPPGATPPPYFYRTFIRPDPERPYSELVLIAMDMRQLELGMQAGYEDPKPTTGLPGEGHIPLDPAIYRRVVATFNGAFKTQHGAYGMMVNRRVLLPPVRGGASVIVTDSHEVGMGSWPQSDEIPPNVVSFRQNLDPLIEDGVPNPTGRRLWGWQVEGTSVMTHRTALCVTPAGHLYYAWGEEIDGPTLGKALHQAGCAYGMHLDMNPAHTGFVFSDLVNPRKGDYQLRLADPGMKISPEKFVRWSGKDFFYVMVRDATPEDASEVHWVPDGGSTSPPAWLPGVYSGTLQIGALEVRLDSFERGHVDFVFRAGTREPSLLLGAGVKTGLEPADAHRVMAAIGLGHTTDSTRYGFAFGGDSPIALRPGYATLVLTQGAPPRIEPPGNAPSLVANQEAVQLPLLALAGKLEPRAHERGELRRRAALCILSSGRVIVAQATHDTSDAVASALVRVGCERVVELDRGSHHPAFLHRAGTSTPPLAGYESSVIYALGRPALPGAFRWKPSGATPSTKPTSYDYPAPSPRAHKRKRAKERD